VGAAGSDSPRATAWKALPVEAPQAPSPASKPQLPPSAEGSGI